MMMLVTVFSFFSVATQRVSGDTTTPPPFTVSYSFDEVRAGITGTDVYTGTTIQGHMPADELEFTKPGVGSFKMYTTLPFLIDHKGNPLTPDKINDTNSPIVSDTIVNGTYIQYRQYHYAVDLLVYSNILLPAASAIQKDDVSVNGWDYDAKGFSRNDNPEKAKSKAANMLLVLEEVAPPDMMDTTSHWAYPGPCTLAKYFANSWSYQSDGDSGLMNYNRLDFRGSLSYKTKTINMQSIFNAVGGNVQLTIKPKINIVIEPFLKNTIGVNKSDVQIYSAIQSVQSIKLRFGVVKNDFAAYSAQFSGNISQVVPPQGTEAKPTDMTPTTLNDQVDTTKSRGYKASVTATATSGTSIPMANDGVQVGAALPMTITGSSTSVPTVSSNIDLIKNAPKNITITPSLKVQPFWILSQYDLASARCWVKYTDPWRDWPLNNLVYPDPADDSEGQTAHNTVTTGVEVLNTFVINRYMITVVVSTLVDKKSLLSTSGNQMQDPRYATYNKYQIDKPGDATAVAYTPPTAPSIWQGIADFFGGLFSNPLSGIIGIIIILVIIIVVVLVIKKFFGGGRGGGGRRGKEEIKTELTFNMPANAQPFQVASAPNPTSGGTPSKPPDGKPRRSFLTRSRPPGNRPPGTRPPT